MDRVDESLWDTLDWGTYAFALGHRIFVIRTERGLTQEDLAERSGLHRNQISNLERGSSNRAPHVADPHLSTIYRVARALDVPPAYLLPDGAEQVMLQSAEQPATPELSAVETELRDMLDGER